VSPWREEGSSQKKNSWNVVSLDSSFRSEWQTSEVQVKETNLNISEPSELSDFTSFLSPSLKKLLEGQCEITSIENGIAKLIILNPMAKMMLNKKENHDAICTALTQTSGQTISHSEFSFMSKDEYFQMKMSN
jgi:hypothetical protein